MDAPGKAKVGGSARRSMIIGEGSLPVQCANILRKHDFQIVAVSSPDEPLRVWAQQHQVPHFVELRDFAGFGRSHEFEYLFSVANYRILPASLLVLPAQYAINYHDAFLPRYAGTYATTWAIMAGEETHGITWHVMTEGVDEGDILKQVKVPVSTQDTAYTLNLKCYYTAIRAFDELAGELKQGTEKPASQNLVERTYFEYTKRPPLGCLISFDATAAQIDAFVRSLDFDVYPNPIGLPKIHLGGTFYVIPRVAVFESRSGAAPGVVAAVSEDCFRVATRTQDVVISSVKTLYGRDVGLKQLVERDGLTVGTILQSTNPSTLDSITKVHTSTCRYERHWIRRLSSLVLPTLPIDRANGSATDSWKITSGEIPAAWVNTLASCCPTDCAGESLAMVHAFFLSNFLHSDRFDVGFSWQENDQEFIGMDQIFAPCVPFNVYVRQETNLKAALSTLAQQFHEMKKRGTYMLDLAARHGQMNLIDPLEPGSGTFTRYPVALRIVSSECDHKQFGTHWNFDIHRDGSSYHWSYNQALDNDSSARDLKQRFNEFLANLVSLGFDTLVQSIHARQLQS